MNVDPRFLATAGQLNPIDRVLVWQDGLARQAPLARLGSASNPGGVRFVQSVEDLPAAVGGKIELLENTTYFIGGPLDLGGAYLQGSRNTVIIGGSSENCIITSTGLSASQALLVSNYSLPCRHVAFTHDIAVDLDATGNADQALDWTGVNFLNCASAGTIEAYSNVIFRGCALLGSGGITFDGSIGTVGFAECLFDTASGTTALTLPASLTITRRFRVIYSAFVTLSGETSLNVSTSATIPVEGYILDTVNFAGGGTYLTGVQHDDNKALFSNNVGVENSAAVGYATMNGNATATTIGTVATPVKAAGSTTFQTGVSQKFSHSDNRLTYTGAITRRFRVTIIQSMLSGNNNQIGTYVAKNGSILAASEIYTTTSGTGRSENVTVQAIVELAQNDYVESWVENDTGTNNITVEDMTMIVEAL